MFKFSSTVLVIAALMTGCASVPLANKTDDAKLKSFPKPEENNAGVYVFRDSMLGSALKKDIWVDGKCLGESAALFHLRVGEYFHAAK